MSRILLTVSILNAMTIVALAGSAPTPAPLLGAVAGPWGLAAGVVGYGAYKLYKRTR